MGYQQGRLALYDIPQLTGYSIDLEGNVYSSVKSGKPKQMKLREHKGRGKKLYLRVHLVYGYYLVHRLIAAVQLGRLLNDDEQVNHKDANTLNNSSANLEVVTAVENVKHAVENNLYPKGLAWYKARNLQRSSEYDYRRVRTASLGVGGSAPEAQGVGND